MGNACPGECASGIQRPLTLFELSQLSNAVRAEIILFRQAALMCETCGLVYVNTLRGVVALGKLPTAKRRSFP